MIRAASDACSRAPICCLAWLSPLAPSAPASCSPHAPSFRRAVPDDERKQKERDALLRQALNRSKLPAEVTREARLSLRSPLQMIVMQTLFSDRFVQERPRADADGQSRQGSSQPSTSGASPNDGYVAAGAQHGMP